MNYHSRQIIISPVVYLMEERLNLGILGMFNGTQPRLMRGGWILRLLPRELHEEAARRTPNATANQKDQIRLRVMELGLATVENVDEVIYNMPIAQYLNLAGDFPKLSRVHFQTANQPRPEWPDNLPLPVYHEHSLIISPLIYLMKKRLHPHPRCFPRGIESGGWILDLLPEELHAEAERRVPPPELEQLSGDPKEVIINWVKNMEQRIVAKSA